MQNALQENTVWRLMQTVSEIQTSNPIFWEKVRKQKCPNNVIWLFY